ncbi:class I SAM-dependent methyltransferase [Nesterenkonia alkaliphila]|uniref:Class I SAM-dependent methyltransferase n=1 Tax=Nesterenkonia alkaliphila TaxID=1463631 RepID=A0A7K1UHG3_9MICC|nr:class I SAM-dependent methyltransferase [Nesterenkonia alkaliphila]MVT25824.1 hypothetical protein [Nesterenkonia alkaliphila]GFZ98577.1 hypothetical protein GCM10011359_29620 [Nesterenkonia alkaliphila]
MTDSIEQLQFIEKKLDQLTEAVIKLSKDIHDIDTQNKEAIEAVKNEIVSQVSTNRLRLQRHVTTSSTETIQQTEALWQLYPQLDTPGPIMPPSGNFAMDPRTLLHLSSLIKETRPKVILELGGGASTIWMGYLTEAFGTKIITVDHLKEYRNITEGYVRRHNFNKRIECRLAPLENVAVSGHEFLWYSQSSFSDVTDIDILLIDGPPQATGESARYPAFPTLRESLSPQALVLLDDTHRKTEQEILERWSSEAPGYETRDRGVSRLAVLQKRRNEL